VLLYNPQWRASVREWHGGGPGFEPRRAHYKAAGQTPCLTGGFRRS